MVAQFVQIDGEIVLSLRTFTGNVVGSRHVGDQQKLLRMVKKLE